MRFEQTNEWARFQQAMGRKVFVFSPSVTTPFQEGGVGVAGEGVAIEKKIIGPLTYVEINGWEPVSGMTQAQTVQALCDMGKQTGAIFVRWTPTLEISNVNFQMSNLSECGLVVPQILVHQVPPKTTLILDLLNSEEELLSKMHEKTRYNIRLAERKGVEVKKVSGDEGFESFWSLMRETARRDKIGIHAKEYYQKMREMVQGEGAQAHLFVATYGGAPLATAVLIICSDTATYLHGGSSSAQRNLMAPHLLQWRMMQYARAQGCRWYDMWGIAPLAQQTQNSKLKTQNYGTWAGITRFKVGFGGETREGAGTFDVVCRPTMYSWLAFMRRFRS